MFESIFIQICAVGSKRHIFSAPEYVLAIQGRSGSSKVHDFGTNRKCIYDFLLVGHCDYGPILHHFWDMVTYWLKVAYFCYPFLIWCPRSLRSLRNFAMNLTVRKVESWGYAPVRPHDRRWSRFGMIPACDGRSDGRLASNGAFDFQKQLCEM